MLSPPPGVAALKSIGVRSDETRQIITYGRQYGGAFTVLRSRTCLRWNEFRPFGPVLRLDPHRLPRGDDPDRAVWYGASSPGAALAEAFQADRTIDRYRRGPYLTGLLFTRTLMCWIWRPTLRCVDYASGRELRRLELPRMSSPSSGHAPSSPPSRNSTVCDTTVDSRVSRVLRCSRRRGLQCRPGRSSLCRWRTPT